MSSVRHWRFRWGTYRQGSAEDASNHGAGNECDIAAASDFTPVVVVCQTRHGKAAQVQYGRPDDKDSLAAVSVYQVVIDDKQEVQDKYYLDHQEYASQHPCDLQRVTAVVCMRIARVNCSAGRYSMVQILALMAAMRIKGQCHGIQSSLPGPKHRRRYWA